MLSHCTMSVGICFGWFHNLCSPLFGSFQQMWRQETSLQRLKRKLTLAGQQSRTIDSFSAWSEALACSKSAWLWHNTTKGLLAQKYDLIYRSSRFCRVHNQRSAFLGTQMPGIVPPKKHTMPKCEKLDRFHRQQATSSPVSHHQRLVLKRWWQFLARYADSSALGPEKETRRNTNIAVVSGLEPCRREIAHDRAIDKGNDESRYSTAMDSTIGAGPLYLSALDQATFPCSSMPIPVLDTAFQPLPQQLAQRARSWLEPEHPETQDTMQSKMRSSAVGTQASLVVFPLGDGGSVFLYTYL